MILAQVCPRYYPYIGGVETHVREISERLVKKGFKVEVLTTDPSGKLPREEIMNGVKVKRFKSWAPNENYHFSRGLKKYLMKYSNKYDVVHAHSYHDFPALYAAQAENRNKLVFSPHYHGRGHTFFRSWLHIPYKLLGKKIVDRADKIICVSNYERRLFAKTFGIKNENITVIPNGVNLEEFKRPEKKKKNNRVILYVGRIEKYKGIHYLIKVLPKLDKGIILDIVGKGPYKPNVVKLTRSLGVENKVKFSQDLPRDKLLQKYADADLFVLLSKHEAYGISVAEALASRTPCVLANTSALKEWVDNENCFGIDYPINLNELANLLNSVIGKDLEELKLCDWSEITETLVNLYES